MHDRESKSLPSLPLEKLAYFRWRDNVMGYENYDSNIEEDQHLRIKLRITAGDDSTWKLIKESEFRLEF